MMDIQLMTCSFSIKVIQGKRFVILCLEQVLMPWRIIVVVRHPKGIHMASESGILGESHQDWV